VSVVSVVSLASVAQGYGKCSSLGPMTRSTFSGAKGVAEDVERGSIERAEDPMARRRIDHATAKRAIVASRRAGWTLREACARAGVHVATACRWQNDDPDFSLKLLNAADRAAEEQYEIGWLFERPPVRWRNECPACRAKLVVRTANGGARFWRCGRWPFCEWASWRPRHPRNCRACGGPRFWSHSRKSVGCDACGMRSPAP